jgi:predicted peptidase
MLSALLLTTVLALAPPKGETKGVQLPPGLKESTFETTIQRPVKLRYLVYLPTGYEKSKASWPLILYLHGAAGRGDDYKKMLWYPILKMISEGKDDLPFIVIAPQCPAAQNWTDTEALVALLEETCKRYRVDRERVYLMGYSLGGCGAWYLAYKNPEWFAAIAPMSGTGDTAWVPQLKAIPAWVFHGAKDKKVPPQDSEVMVAALKKAGAEVKFSLDPNRDHRPPTEAEHLELFKWFLEHRKTPAPEAGGKK